ncbi:MAG: hypothetical protein HRU38_14210 [Saccharospirillaceae bacterium]|nr:hypothetical protein [Pseudomonadales bacterium]NRB79797.1 hypothetical protein [Saccharospirillaceae bacterium]
MYIVATLNEEKFNNNDVVTINKVDERIVFLLVNENDKGHKDSAWVIKFYYDAEGHFTNDSVMAIF